MHSDRELPGPRGHLSPLRTHTLCGLAVAPWPLLNQAPRFLGNHSEADADSWDEGKAVLASQRLSERFPALVGRCVSILGAVRTAQSGQTGSVSWPCLSPAAKAGHHQHSSLKNTPHTDPSWVLLKCQEQAHDKVVKEGRRVVQTVRRWQGGGQLTPCPWPWHPVSARD